MDFLARTLRLGALLSTLALPAAAAAPGGRYVILSSTVEDKVTGLVWQRAPGSSGIWAVSKSACDGFDPGDHSTGWRLPTIAELQSLVDVRAASPAIDHTAFPDTAATPYWSSTADHSAPTSQWAVEFKTGATVRREASASAAVRCVRAR